MDLLDGEDRQEYLIFRSTLPRTLAEPKCCLVTWSV